MFPTSATQLHGRTRVNPSSTAKAGTQGREFGQRTGSPLPRGRTEVRGDSNASHFALIALARLLQMREYPAAQRLLILMTPAAEPLAGLEAKLAVGHEFLKIR